MSRGFLFRQSATSAARVPVTSEADDLVIVLQELELPPVVLTAGETKEKYLVRPGKNILGSKGSISISLATREFKGGELGSVAKTKKRFKALEAYLAKPEKDRLIKEMKMTTAIYLTSSYLRENALGKMQHIPINIGIAVKGLEYQ